MKFEDSNPVVKYLFLLIWSFFVFRITSYIDLNQYTSSLASVNWFSFLKDSLSIFILIGLFIYLLANTISNKKISITSILIIYPIIGLLAYFENGIKNLHQDSIVWHHFITLSSLFLFLAAIQSNKLFDYKFKKLLLKIILIFAFSFFLFLIIPDVITKLLFNQDFRSSYKSVSSIFGLQFNISQNINGQTRIIFVVLVISLILFKKFILKKKITAHLFFFIAVLLCSVIYLSQSRFNILASFVFSFFLLFNIKNINIKKKIIYFLIIFTTPFVLKIHYGSDNRFHEPKILSQNKSESHASEYESKILSQNKFLSYLANGDLFGCNNYEKIFKTKFSQTDFEIQHSTKVLGKLCSGENISTEDYLYLMATSQFIYKNISTSSFSEIEKKYFEQVYINFINLNKVYANSEMAKKCSSAFSTLDSISTGRICGWTLLLKNIKNDLFLGKGFFADQFYLLPFEKLSSNSWVNILYNAGIMSLFLYSIFLTFFLFKFFKIKNINHQNYLVSVSHYLFLYFIIRSALEDTIAFVNIDLLFICICSLIIKENAERSIA